MNQQARSVNGNKGLGQQNVVCLEQPPDARVVVNRDSTQAVVGIQAILNPDKGIVVRRSRVPRVGNAN